MRPVKMMSMMSKTRRGTGIVWNDICIKKEKEIGAKSIDHDANDDETLEWGGGGRCYTA